MKDVQKVLLPIKDSVRRLYDAQLRKKDIDKYYDEVKKKESVLISNFMVSNFPREQNSFQIELDEGEKYYTNHTKLQVTKVRRKKVLWDINKLKERLGKECCKDIINKTYTINDIDGLIKYLKSCGVDPKKFKTFINVSEELDETKLNTLYETGAIRKESLAGCYDLEISEPYIRLTELKV